MRSPDAGQVLVEVRASGINVLDWKIRQGLLKGMMPMALPAVSVAGTPLLVDGTGPGGALRVEWRNGEGMRGRAPVAGPPVEASNGLVYLLDDVTLG